MKSLFCALVLLQWSFAATAGKIALIIDDIGYKKQDQAAFELPASVTFSILPHTPYSSRFSSLANAQQREVMLHVPMEALAGNRLGPGAITAGMGDIIIKNQLADALRSVPNAIGINNHMGSKLTQLSQPMRATMAFLKQEQLFFIDSRTTKYSKAQDIADAAGVPNMRRHVFIDHVQSPKHMQLQFNRLLLLAKKYKQAIGIAHPHPSSIAFLNQALPRLKEQNIELVPISTLIQQHQIAKHAVGNNSTSAGG